MRLLIERERARAEEAEIRAMFDEAWDALSDQERQAVRAEREEWFGNFASRKGS